MYAETIKIAQKRQRKPESGIKDGFEKMEQERNLAIGVSIRKSAKRGHCTCAEQECCITTD